MLMSRLPIPSNDQARFSIIQYADDTIIKLKASQRQLLCLKAILESFAKSTCLRFNYNKSRMIALNMFAEKVELMIGVFVCQLQDMSFTYLGLPMGTARPRVEHFEPIMNRVER
jgi:hypothetical protein